MRKHIIPLLAVMLHMAWLLSAFKAGGKKPFLKTGTWPFLVTGVAVSDSLRTQKTLSQLELIKAFPTTIFIDKKGNVRKIHTGLDGPATGKYYEAFKQEFNEEITTLLKEDQQ